MKIIFKGKLGDSARNLIRRCGYGEIRDFRSGETSYARKLGGGLYPRFHLYINQETADGLVLNLHLDQRQTRYEGQTAHSGEYDGELVENEAARIREIIEKWLSTETKSSPAKEDEGFWKKFWQKL
jgi:hypothetical protein